jgi:hypothetical protein
MPSPPTVAERRPGQAGPVRRPRSGRTSELADDVRGLLVLPFCRSAIEAAPAVEELIEDALTTTQIAALALFGSADQGAKVLPRVRDC